MDNAYFSLSDNSAVAILTPKEGDYSVKLSGAPLEKFTLDVTISNYTGDGEEPAVKRKRIEGTLDATHHAVRP